MDIYTTQRSMMRDELLLRFTAARELNRRIWMISFSMSGFTEETETMTTAMVSPMALNISSA